ncbi:hypothetical protein [Methylosinus trichosporium]|nr:hypothetical protein [Methylosinus trichosporium]
MARRASTPMRGVGFLENTGDSPSLDRDPRIASMSVSQIILQTTRDIFQNSRFLQAADAPERACRRAFTAVFSVAALWFVLHPYHGVVHDGRLYALQALNALQADQFASDLYFRYGSQDSFTVFSSLYRPLVAAFGVSSAHYITTLAGEAAFVFGLAFFVRTLLPDRREALFAFVGAIAEQSSYGSSGIFHYDEIFATPRPFAEALVLAAFGVAFTGKPVLGWLALAAAAALHPLMALTGIASLGLLAAQKDRRLLMLGAATAALGVLLGASSVQPFARLFETFDPEWFDIVRRRCGFGFLTRWTIDDFLTVAAALGPAVICLRWRDRALRSLALVFSVVSLCGMALTFISGDVGRDVLVVNIQPWRALWLSRLLGNIIVVVIVLRAPPDSLYRWPLLVAAILSAFARLGFFMPALADFLLIVALAFCFFESRSAKPVTASIRKAVLALSGVAAVSPVLFGWILSIKPGFSTDCALVLVGAVSCGLLIALDRGRVFVPGASVAATLALAAALLLNDRRTEWRRFIEAPGAADDLRGFVGDSANLYWDDSPEIMWFKLGRPSYYSCLQGTGVMFYRGTAIDYARRGSALAKLDAPNYHHAPDHACYHQPEQPTDGPLSLDDLRRVCRALPDLDGIVLGVALPDASPRIWNSPAPRYYVGYDKIETVTTFYKYMCRDLRSFSFRLERAEP